MADNRFDSAFETDNFEHTYGARLSDIDDDLALDRAAQPEFDASVNLAREAGAEPPKASYIGDVWKTVASAGVTVASDVGMGAVETPRQIIGGVRDAGQAALDLSRDVGDIIEKKLPLGGIQILNDKGEFDLQYKANASEIGNAELPDVPDAKSETGALVRNVAQFLTGFAAGGAALSGVKATSALGVAGKAAAQGAIADFTVFDEHERRLSNLVEEFPSLSNPITAYLQAEEDDGALEGRFKNAVEGLGMGVLTDALFTSLRAIKAARRARPETAAKRAQKGVAIASDAAGKPTGRVASTFDLLGNPDAPLTSRATPDLVNKQSVAAVEAELGVPADVAARGVAEEASAAATGLSRVGGDQSDFYVNFARINSPDDIKKVIQSGANAFRENIDVARRGVRSNAETTASAADIDAWDMLMDRRTGQAFNAEESVAARELWVSSGDKLKQTAELAVKDPSPENLYQFRRMLATFHAVQKEALAARAEAGRALQAWSIPVGSDAKRLLEIDDAVFRSGGKDVNEELAKAVLSADKAGGIAAVSRFADKSVYARTREAIQEYWINAILSGPKTHLVNMMSNASVIGLSMAETATAARMGRLFGDDSAITVGEAASQWAGVRGGLIDGLRNAAKAFRTGESGFGINKVEAGFERSISSTAWNLRSDSIAGRSIDALGAVVNAPGKALQAEDEFFKTVGYRMHLHGQAHRRAMDMLSSGKIQPDQVKQAIADIIDNPPDDIHLESAYQAAYQTFTNRPDGAFGKFASGLNKMRHEYPALRFIAPFVNTPANILDYTLERTPLAPLTARFRAAVAEGGAKAELAHTKLAMGSATIMLATDLAIDGHITGSGPSDYRERAALRRQGWQPYSIKLGDNYVAFNRLDPLGFLLGMGGDVAEIVRNGENLDGITYDELEQSVIGATFLIAEGAMSRTYLRGVSDMVEALNAPERFAARFVENFTGSFIPSGVREVTNFQDPKLRYTNNILTNIKNRIPGYKEGLPPRRDAYGREISYSSGFGQAWDAFSPLYGSKYDPEPVDLETQKDGWFIATPRNYFREKATGGETVSLRERPDIYSRLVELRGATKPSAMGENGERLIDKYGDLTMLETLNSIVGGEHELSDRYRMMADASDREDFLKDVVSDYYKSAKKVIFAEFPEIMEIGQGRAKRIAERRAARRLEMESN